MFRALDMSRPIKQDGKRCNPADANQLLEAKRAVQGRTISGIRLKTGFRSGIYLWRSPPL